MKKQESSRGANPEEKKEQAPEEKEKFEFNLPVQERILGTILHFGFQLAEPCLIELINPKYFTNPVHENLCRIIKNFYTKYKKLPIAYEFLQEVGQFLKLDKNKKLSKEEYEKATDKILELSEENFQYPADKLINFCRYMVAQKALLNGARKHMPKLNIRAIIEDLKKAERIGVDISGQVETGNEFLSKKLEPRDVFIKNWAERHTITLFGGKAGRHKTGLMMNMMLQLAKGGFFLEFVVTKPRKVIYLNQDMAEHLFQGRLKQMTGDESEDSERPEYHKNYFILNRYSNPLKLDRFVFLSFFHSFFQPAELDGGFLVSGCIRFNIQNRSAFYHIDS